MFKRFVVSVILSCCASGVWAADVPRYAQELSGFTESKSGGDQSVRMRITVASEAAQAEQSVRVGDVLLCSSSQCYRAHTSGYLNIANTAKGKADVVVDVWIPIATITDVYFTEIGGPATMNGHLKLETPLAIDKEFPGVELMIGVKKQSVGTRTTYIPVQSASMYFADDNELVHYLPSVQTVAELSLGTKITIPAGALDKPQIFNVGIAPVGEMFPKIDIFPYISLKKSASVEVRALRNAGATHELIVPINPAERNDDSFMLNAPTTLPLVKHTVYRTAVIEPSILEKSLPSNVTGVSGPSSAKSPPKSCSEYLAQPIVLGLINFAAMHSGAARIRACENIAPFVHIVVTIQPG